MYSVQYTRYNGVQCTVHERVAPQQEGKEDYWAAEDQPREHLQELLSLSIETPCCTVTLWIYMLSKHLQHNVLQVLEWGTVFCTSVQGISTMDSVQCNVHTCNWRPTSWAIIQCAVCIVQCELYTNVYSVNCTIICTQYMHTMYNGQFPTPWEKFNFS